MSSSASRPERLLTRPRGPAAEARTPRAARILASLLALASLLQLARALVLPPHPSARVVDSCDRDRYAPLRPLLAGVSVIGYVADYPPDRDAVGSPYYVAQYVLAPVVLVEGAAPPLVLVDGPPDRHRLPGPPGRVHLVADLGNGVRLYRRTDR